MKVIFRRVAGKIKAFRISGSSAKKISSERRASSDTLRRLLRRNSDVGNSKSMFTMNKTISGRISTKEKGLYNTSVQTVYDSFDHSIVVKRLGLFRKTPKGKYREIGEFNFSPKTSPSLMVMQPKYQNIDGWHSRLSDLEKPYIGKGIAKKVYDQFEKQSRVKLIAGHTNNYSGKFWQKREYQSIQAKKWKKTRGHLEKGYLKSIGGMRNYKKWD